METNTVYYSLKSNFPAFDMVYKETKKGKNKLVCIQVTRQRKKEREINRSAFEQFCQSMGNIGINDLELVLVPNPNLADESKLVVKEEPYPFTVWKLPRDYSRHFE